MFRTFGPRTLTGTAQPIIGDVLAAALVEPTSPQLVPITVANSAIYQQGDRIVIDPLTVNSDEYKVEQILNSTTLLCSYPVNGGHAHSNGAIIQLGNACIDLVVLPLAGGAGPLYIGTDNNITNTPTGNIITRIEKVVAGTAGKEWHGAGGTGNNIINTAEAWMVGTAADVALTYALVL
jgi:hypothetical protein